VKPKAPRKPRELYYHAADCHLVHCKADYFYYHLYVMINHKINVKEARKLAAWLIKAADYLSWKENEKTPKNKK